MYAAILTTIRTLFWTKAVGASIPDNAEKKTGVRRTDKLRVIQILEAHLNMTLQIIFGRCLIAWAEKRGNIPPTQWGSRSNHSSVDCVLQKRLSDDGLKILKQSAVIFNNDARSAFDRIIPLVGGIVLRRLGASNNAVKALLEILQKMRYQIWTGLGLLEQEFSNLSDWDLGTLQGSGAKKPG